MYCALLLRNNSQYPEMITLFEEKDILPYISSKTEANVTNKIYDFYVNGEVIKNKIWGNILPKLKDGETVYLFLRKKLTDVCKEQYLCETAVKKRIRLFIGKGSK